MIAESSQKIEKLEAETASLREEIAKRDRQAEAQRSAQELASQQVASMAEELKEAKNVGDTLRQQVVQLETSAKEAEKRHAEECAALLREFFRTLRRRPS